MGAPEVPPLCRETSVSRTANVGTVGKNGLNREISTIYNGINSSTIFRPGNVLQLHKMYA